MRQSQGAQSLSPGLDSDWCVREIALLWNTQIREWNTHATDHARSPHDQGFDFACDPLSPGRASTGTISLLRLGCVTLPMLPRGDYG